MQICVKAKTVQSELQQVRVSLDNICLHIHDSGLVITKPCNAHKPSCSGVRAFEVYF